SSASIAGRSARAICFKAVKRETSAQTNDQFKIVVGPVSIPFTGRSVNDWAYTLSLTVIACSQETSPTISGGFTEREPYDCTQPYCVTAKPFNFSPKYSTISFLSNSP